MYKIFNVLSLKSLTVLACYWFLYNSFQDKTACIGKHGFDNALSFWLLFAGAVCCCGSFYAIDKFYVLPYLSDLEFELQTWDIALCLFCFFFFRITNLSTHLKTTQIMFMMLCGLQRTLPCLPVWMGWAGLTYGISTMTLRWGSQVSSQI